MLGRDELTTGFIEHAAKAPDAGTIDEATWAQLRKDADQLGLIGMMAVLADPAPKVDPAIRDELVAPLARDLRDALGDKDELDLDARVERFLAARGARGLEILSRIASRVIHEVWSLEQNKLGIEDVLAGGDLMSWSGPKQEAREAIKRLVRLSRPAARATLGHLPEQLELVHRLGQNEEVSWTEVDRRLHEFSPRVFGQRLPAIMRYLLSDEPRLRLAFVAWARLRGIVLPRAAVLSIGDSIVPEKPLNVVKVLVERAATRATLREADAASKIAHIIERAFLARTIPAPSAK
jgi:hypothetical protein